MRAFNASRMFHDIRPVFSFFLITNTDKRKSGISQEYRIAYTYTIFPLLCHEEIPYKNYYKNIENTYVTLNKFQ